MHRTLVSLIVVAGVCAFPDRADAESTWFPMHIGNEWDYVDTGGAHEVVTFTRTMTLAGREVFVLTYGPSVDNTGLENYWCAGPDGDVLLSGFFRSDDGFGWLYDPPIPLVDAPLSLGKTWSHATRVTLLPTMEDLGINVFGFQVYTAGLLSVPAGIYFAYGIGYSPPTLVVESARDLDATGRRSSGPSVSDWWTDGLGRPQYNSFQLSAFSFPTPTRGATWGKVKALYR